MKAELSSAAIPRARCAVRGVAPAVLVAAFLFSAAPIRAAENKPLFSDPAMSSDPGSPHVSIERSGMLATREGLTLHLTTDLGSVHVSPLAAGAAPAVRYSVHIETDAQGELGKRLVDRYALSARSTSAGVEITGNLPPQPARDSSSSAQFWVRFDVTVPAGYSLDVSTGAGDIATGDIGGTASLVTQGGNIFTGRIGVSGVRDISSGRPLARLETQGGHIHVKDVAGNLTAFTAGGHIVTGNIAGDATLKTGGGHITAAGISGRAELSTEGGNITVGHAGSYVSVKTGGGQIDFGEVNGSVRAQTGGGGIRVMYVSGPMEVESSGGSICLTRVAGSVRAATNDGTITAWISPTETTSGGAVHLAGASQLASGAGDIIVFLPRNLAANIEAIVENGGEHHIEADPGLALQVQKSGSGPVHAIAMLNGGGAPLRLRTNDGRIRLQFLDSEIKLRESLIREQLARLRRDFPDIPLPPSLAPIALHQPPDVMSPSAFAPATPPGSEDTPSGWTGSWIDKLELAILGGVREDADEFQNRLTYAPHPTYPEIARRAGVQGIVRLQVRLTKNGSIEVQKILEGEPSLADAAILTVKRWQGRPARLDGKPVDVISTVTFDFKLR
jgi:TonB family protein